MRVIGITGGVGSGKSEVLRYLKEAYGAWVCQMDETAKEVATNEMMDYESEETLYDPEKNIQIGVKYYADLKEIFGNDMVALAAYNAGMGTVSRLDRTRNYKRRWQRYREYTI